MAKSNAEKQTYSALERFLYIVLLPVLFTMVLVGVLLTLFGYDVKGALLDAGRNIPVVRQFVPESGDGGGQAPTNPASAALLLEERVAELESLLAEKNAEIAALQSDLASRDRIIAELEAGVEQMLLDREQEAEAQEETRSRLKSLAGMYAGMSASKAASILEQMTMPELVLILYEMGAAERGDILARMEPAVAAEASLHLKDLSEANWAEFERRAREGRNGQDDGSASALTEAELAGTFAAMEPASAAKILLELKRQNGGRAVAILAAMTDQARSRVLAAIADTSPEDAAVLADQLGGR